MDVYKKGDNNLTSCSETYSPVEQDLIKTLSELRDDTQREYEIIIGDLVSSNKGNLGSFKKILEDESQAENIRYAAFFAICTLYRRSKEFTWYGKCLERYEDEFKAFRSFDHLKAMYLVEIATSKTKMLDAVEAAEKAVNANDNNAGFLHSFAVVIARGFEESYFNREENGDLLVQGIKASDKAIRLTPEYAKFYSTQGRLQDISGNHQAARLQIKKAIDMENSESKDYALRIGDYQKQLMDICYNEKMNHVAHTFNQYEERIMDLNKKVDNIVADLERARTRNIEFLGFFTALVSFTIGAIQISSHQTFNDALRLILVLCGGLMLVLGGFGIILNGMDYIRRSIVMWLMGISVVFIVLMTSFWMP